MHRQWLDRRCALGLSAVGGQVVVDSWADLKEEGYAAIDVPVATVGFLNVDPTARAGPERRRARPQAPTPTNPRYARPRPAPRGWAAHRRAACAAPRPAAQPAGDAARL